MKTEKQVSKNRTQLKVIVGFALALIILGIAALINFKSVNNLTETVNTLTAPDEKLVCTRQLQNDLTEVESNMRAFTLTHDEKYLSSFNSVSDSIHNRVARLKFLTNDNDSQFALADTISHFVAAREGLLKSFIEKRKTGFADKLENSAAYFEMSNYSMLQSASENNDTAQVIVASYQNEKLSAPEKSKGLIGWFKNIFNPATENSKDEIGSIVQSDKKFTPTVSSNQSKKKLSVLDVNQILMQQQELLKKQLQVWSLDELVLLQEDKNIMDKIHSAINSLEEDEIKIVRSNAMLANIGADKAADIITFMSVLGILTMLIFIYLILTDITRSNHLRIQLESEKAKAEELANVKEKFLSNMSHEIRTPLNSIIGFTEQLSKEKASDKQKKFISAIEHSSDHLLSIVNQILDFSRIESGKMQNNPVTFSHSELVKEVYETFKLKAAEKGIWFSFSVNEDVPEFLKGDLVSMKQILLNLVGNAIKFTSKGSVDIRCSAVLDYGDMYSIKTEVSDTGEGITHEMQEKIFEEFTQADADITRRFGGTGLGLAISKKLAQLLNGNISVESKVGEGSTFTAVIPFLKSDAPQSTEKYFIPAQELEQLQNKSVLLVDDESMNLLLGKIILESWGVRVQTSTNGKDALMKYDEHNFDLILLDIQMPEMSGVELAEIIHRNETLAQANHIPILALTANLYSEQLHESGSARFDDILIKPFKERDLFEKLNKLLHLSIENKNVQEEKIISVSSTIDSPLYKLDYLKKTSGTNTDFVVSMIQSFIINNTSNIALLNDAFILQDWNLVRRLAHKMIPSFSYLEINKVMDDLKKLEKISVSQKDVEQAPEIILRITTTTQQLITQLKTEAEKLNRENGKMKVTEN